MNPPTSPSSCCGATTSRGPRYTSYPTAPVWKESYGPADYGAILEASAAAASARLPSRSTSTCPSASGSATSAAAPSSSPGADHGLEHPYLDVLEREIDWVADSASGGGPRRSSSSTGAAARRRTSRPTLLERLGRRIFDRFRLAPDAEIGVEVDPRVTTPRASRDARRGSASTA